MQYLVEKLLKESFLASVICSWQEFLARLRKNNPLAGKKIKI
jgi:hypothetical protein